jgi:hypothetical protein
MENNSTWITDLLSEMIETYTESEIWQDEKL